MMNNNKEGGIELFYIEKTDGIGYIQKTGHFY